MDPRLRADEVLARARARGGFVVTPDNATSPMDASTTQRIPRAVNQGEESTNQYPIPQYTWPTQDVQSMAQQRDPEQYIAFPPEPQDTPDVQDSWHNEQNEFGSLGSEPRFPES